MGETEDLLAWIQKWNVGKKIKKDVDSEKEFDIL